MPLDWESHARAVNLALGQDVQYIPAGGVARTVRVGWAQTPINVMVSDTAMAADEPRIIAMQADVPELKRGDVFVIGTSQYKARELNPHLPERTISIDLEQP